MWKRKKKEGRAMAFLGPAQGEKCGYALTLKLT